MSKARAMTGGQLQDAVAELAHVFGWLVAHFRAGRAKDGSWRTHVQYDGKGFPDLVLTKDHVILYREIKGARESVSTEQRIWLRALNGRVWRPKSWDSGEIERELRGEFRCENCHRTVTMKQPPPQCGAWGCFPPYEMPYRYGPSIVYDRYGPRW